jgi:hypothetical protein
MSAPRWTDLRMMGHIRELLMGAQDQSTKLLVESAPADDTETLLEVFRCVHMAVGYLDEQIGDRKHVEPAEDPPPSLAEREAFAALDELDHAVSELLSGGDRIHMAKAVANAVREIRTFMAETTD